MIRLGLHRPVAILKQQVPNIVRALHKQMKEKSIKTRQGCLNLLTELINVSPGALTAHIPSLSIICHFCKTNHIQAGRKFILITAALPVSIIMCVCITYYLPLQEFNVRHKRGMIRKIIVTMATTQCRCTVEPTFEGCEKRTFIFHSELLKCNML